MKSNLTIDGAGRVVIPKPLRDRLNLSSGDSLEVETVGDTIVLRPTRDEPTMFKQDGMWVIKTGKPLPLEDANAAIESVREERHRQILGPWPK